MTTYYVGPGGNDANDGLSWANRKLTLNGAEDIPVAAGDIVYVGPGTYREMLTCDVSGSSGSPITYIGDYTGANTDGVGGVVRITGSDNDQTAARTACIVATNINYRTFKGFRLDFGSSYAFDGTNVTYIILDQLFSESMGTRVFQIDGTSNNVTIQNCYAGGATQHRIIFEHTAAVDNCNCIVQNCIAGLGGGADNNAIVFNRYGNGVVKNCLILKGRIGVYALNLTAGQTTTVNNCLISHCNVGLQAGASGMITENYNNIFSCSTARTNVDVGANSTAYDPLFDARWFFELVNGGSILSPFDLASYSQLINVAGTSPTTTDMRGTSAIGGVREWGALEYDSSLDIEAGSGGGTVTKNVVIPMFIKRRR